MGRFAKEHPDVIRFATLAGLALGGLGVALLAVGVLLPAAITGASLLAGAYAGLAAVQWTTISGGIAATGVAALTATGPIFALLAGLVALPAAFRTASAVLSGSEEVARRTLDEAAFKKFQENPTDIAGIFKSQVTGSLAGLGQGLIGDVDLGLEKIEKAFESAAAGAKTLAVQIGTGGGGGVAGSLGGLGTALKDFDERLGIGPTGGVIANRVRFNAQIAARTFARELASIGETPLLLEDISCSGTPPPPPPLSEPTLRKDHVTRFLLVYLCPSKFLFMARPQKSCLLLIAAPTSRDWSLSHYSHRHDCKGLASKRMPTRAVWHSHGAQVALLRCLIPRKSDGIISHYAGGLKR